MLFMSYLRKFYYQRSQRISPRNLYNFRFHIFVCVKFQVNFFIWWREVLASIFCIWMFQHLLLTMFYLVKLLCHLCWDHLIVYTWASFYTIFIYISILTPNTTLSWILQLNKYWNQTEWGLSCFSVLKSFCLLYQVLWISKQSLEYAYQFPLKKLLGSWLKLHRFYRYMWDKFTH